MCETLLPGLCQVGLLLHPLLERLEVRLDLLWVLPDHLLQLLLAEVAANLGLGDDVHGGDEEEDAPMSENATQYLVQVMLTVAPCRRGEIFALQEALSF